MTQPSGINFSRRSRLIARSALALAVAAVPLLPAAAQTAPPATQSTTAARLNGTTSGSSTRGVTTQPGGNLQLNFRDASIDAVLDELSSAAGFIVVKIVKPEGRVSLVSKQPVTPADAVKLLNTVLGNAGYTAIQQGRILKVVPLDQAKYLNIPVRTGNDPAEIEPTDELITQVIPLRYADAKQLREDLASMVKTDAPFTSNQSSNALIITDTAANVRRLVEIVSSLDTHLADSSDVRVFQLEYSNAASAAKLINDLFGTDQQQGRGNQSNGFQSPWSQFFNRSRGGDNRGRGDENQPGAVRGARIYAASDERTNTVVVTGPPQALDLIAKVIHEIDSNPAAEETVFIYRLKNADAANVEAVMNILFNGTAGNSVSRTGSSAARNNGRYSAGSLSNRGTGRNSSSGSRGGIGSSRGSLGGGGGFGSNGSFGSGSTFGSRFGGTGGLGTFGTGSFGGLGRGLSSSAQQTAADLANQVSVIADPDTNSLLVRTSPGNYVRVQQILDELDRPVSQVLIKVLIAEVTHDNASDLGFEFSILNLRSSGLGQSYGTDFGVNNSNSGMVVSVLEDNITATLRALETAGKLDVLSRPYILASDNQLASITVGQEIPFVTNSRVTDNGDTINTVEYDDIGILLDVVPHINPEGLVILDVAPEISTLTAQTVPISDTASVPVIAKRSAESRVAVKNGQTVVIGGLMEDRKTDSISKVPILGDIPIIKHAFRRHTTTKTKTELLIFLTPHVAGQPDALEGMGREELEGAKIVPYSDPKTFQEHMEGLKRGEKSSTTAPAVGSGSTRVIGPLDGGRGSRQGGESGPEGPGAEPGGPMPGDPGAMPGGQAPPPPPPGPMPE